ncbi:MAG TPA: MFS transporter [Burkholderiales bacterium]|nr:MFS transporter [Burkholderiales bacterium]
MAAADHDDVEFGGELHGVANFTRSFHVELRPQSGSTWNNRFAASQQSMISLQRYAALFAQADIGRTFAISLLGRLPIGLTGLAILLLEQTSSGSFAQGGAAAACYVVGLAAVAPLLGRAIDRYGPQRILICTGVLFPAALIALVFAVDARSTAWTLVLAGGAGASFPPITVCVRTYFRRRLAEEGLLAAAYSAESVVIELIFIVGPMLVALFIAKASAALAVWFSATCGLAGTLLFLRSPALRCWHIEPRRSRSLLGPLTERGFPALVGVVLCFSSAFGFLEVGVVAYASEAAQPALAGVLLGITSAGSALGGFAYGSRGWHYPLARQFVAALAVMAAGLGMLALGWQPWLFAPWAALAGIAMAPALIIQSMLAAKISHAEHATEAFTWVTSALLAGVGIGLAAGGALLEIFPSNAALAAGACAALVAALLALAFL